MRLVPDLRARCPRMLVGALLLAGAVGCQNENDFQGAPVPPIAIIRPIQSGPAFPGDPDAGIEPYEFRIDGRDSYDPNAVEPNGIYEYEWTILSMPAGATADIGGGGVANFVTDTPGNYQIGLRVRDINDFTWSLPVQRKLHAFPVSGLAAVLEWATDVNDVDLHLIQDTQGGGLFDEELDCHFANLRPDWVPEDSPDGDPSLDHDEVDGLGPETVELPVPTIGEAYRVVVHYFSDDGFAETEAEVRVFVNGAEVAELERELVANQVWDVGVFDWSGPTGAFQATDTISEY